MKKYISDIAALCVIFVTVALFFLRLFWPVPQLIVTPDFGRSDAWHFSFGQKYALWQSLQEHSLPLWNKDIGDGFPLLAEGQTGTFFLPNLILFSLPDPVLGYNLALALSILTFGWGMYWCCRLLKFTPTPSLFGALTLTFSGLPILHLTHITLLQGMSLLPLLVAMTLKLNASFFWTILFAFVGTQQLFAGFPQATFLTMLLCMGFVLLHPKSTGRFIFAFGLMVGLSAVQLLPSNEFLQQSTNPSGFNPQAASLYSFPIKHLITFLFPFALGNPKFGAYPPFYEFDGSIFWENTAYLGIIPLLFAILAKKTRFTLFLLTTAGVSLLLAWGKYSPLYLVYSFWPFTLFRVPSRFLWIVVFCIVLLAVAGFTKYVRNRYISILAFFNIPLLMFTWWSYHMIVPAHDWITSPESTQNTIGRTLTIGAAEAHNQFFTVSGWATEKPYYFLRNGLTPESNLVWGISQHDALSGRSLRRPNAASQLFKSEATISAQMMNYFHMFSIQTILSWIPLKQNGLLYLKTLSDNGLSLNIYRNELALPRIRIVHEATTAATLAQAYISLNNPSFQPDKTVLLESHETQPFTGKGEAKLDVIKDDHEHIAVFVSENSRSGLLIIGDTYYPGWVARIDGKETPIFAANLSQRAIVLPEGEHTVTFDYEPQSVKQGMFISITTLLMVVLILFWKLRTHQTIPVHEQNRQHSHDR